MDDLRLLKEQLEAVKKAYQKLAWRALMALQVYEDYLLEQKTAKDAGRRMRELFDDIPDVMDGFEFGDFTEP